MAFEVYPYPCFAILPKMTSRHWATSFLRVSEDVGNFFGCLPSCHRNNEMTLTSDATLWHVYVATLAVLCVLYYIKFKRS